MEGDDALKPASYNLQKENDGLVSAVSNYVVRLTLLTHLQKHVHLLLV
jgi:hypothetical protein